MPKSKYCELNGKRQLSEKQATKSVNKHYEYGKFLRKYKCPWCADAWHLTHHRE